jgi:hypothetical protein
MNQLETAQSFSVRLDGLPVEEYGTYEEALAAARNLKTDLPDQLVTVWDLVAGNGHVVER